MKGPPQISQAGAAIRWAAAALVLFAGAATATGASAGNALVVGAFSSAPEGTDPPPEWKPLTFKKVATHTVYTVVRDGDAAVVRADSRAGASGLTREVSIDLKEYPIVAWRWKVANVLAKGDVTKKSGDDYAARLYITFAYDPDRVGFSRKAKYTLGRILFGNIPIAAINYIWDRRTPQGTIVPNAYTDFVKMVVVQSGETDVGRWVQEERNLYQDYTRAFREEPPLVNGVAIMTDTDDTRETATAFYGDIAFKRAR